MKTIISFLTVIFITGPTGQILGQGKETKDVRITGSYYETATIEPTVARIKSLKLPAGTLVERSACRNEILRADDRLKAVFFLRLCARHSSYQPRSIRALFTSFAIVSESSSISTGFGR